MRKGVMDIPLRAKISQEVNDRFMDDLSTLKDQSPTRDLINQITRHQTQNRQSLSDAKFGQGITQKQLSAKISRHLRLLRVHGLIRKLPKQNRYQLTLKGVKLTNILNAFLAASTEQLIKMAA